LPERGQDRRLSLGELLAALAIIGALSTLLLPAFARARANARAAVCLGNIRTIAQAVRMYLTDNDDSLPPVEHDPQVLAYFDTRPGGRGLDMWDPADSPHCLRAKQSNPYLRWPVILDEYLLTRDVWRCPDARLQGGASFIYGGADWLAELQANEGKWGGRSSTGLCPRLMGYPAGWGGEVTDSLRQRRLAVPRSERGKQASAGMFLQSIAANEVATEDPWLASEDPAWFVVVADGGGSLGAFSTGTLAYPDLCHLECASAAPADPMHWQADWENCPWTRQCGAIAEMKLDVNLRRPYARHHGGVNVGFLDGHAQWFDSEEVIALSPTHRNPQRGKLRGYLPWGPTRDWPRDPAIPPLY
jgi:prepilin-type processing-associated H-X9-DG protein